MPEEGIPLVPRSRMLTYEEILRFTSHAVSRGINKVRLTGGEPLVRKGIRTLIGDLADMPGIKDLAMTTNGILLSEMAVDLRQAGLQRLNISLDTLDQHRYRT
jgi:cyclic pyranopterin phosphate synthase